MNHVQNLRHKPSCFMPKILSGAFAGCEALRDEQPANVPVPRDSQRCRGSEATSTTSLFSGRGFLRSAAKVLLGFIAIFNVPLSDLLIHT